MTSIAFWTILVGIAANISCSLVGCYLVLRRMSLLGDAISHAVLPGIALAFLLTGKISGPAIVIGAMIIGVLTAFLTQVIAQATRVPEDASLGVVFTAFFAAGVVLITVGARHVDLDAGCVLYGLIEFTPFDTITMAGTSIPKALVTLGFTFVLVLIVLGLFWKEIKLAAFDPALATSLGFSSNLLHYLMMALVAGVTVAAFEAVGSILVVAMLIVPAATAQLLTDRYLTMYLWAMLVAIFSAVVGYYGAVVWNTSVAGMMAVAAGGFFTLALVLAPHHGLAAKLIRQFRLSLRIVREDILGLLYRAEEGATIDHPTLSELKPLLQQRSENSWLSAWAMKQLLHRQLIVADHKGIGLTPAGRVQGAQLVRAHRLLEAYLEQNVALPADHLHAPAEKLEHYVGPDLLQTLARETKQPAQDPHGRAIPDPIANPSSTQK